MSITPSPGTPAQRVKRSLHGRLPRSIVSRVATPVPADRLALTTTIATLPDEAVHRVHDFVRALIDEQTRYPLWDLAEPFTYAGPLWVERDEAVRRLLHVRAMVALGGEVNVDAFDALDHYGRQLGMTDEEILSVLTPVTFAATTGKGLTWTRS